MVWCLVKHRDIFYLPLLYYSLGIGIAQWYSAGERAG
jgi:hypothetical protein